MRILLLFLAFVISLLPVTAFASDEDWHVAKASSQVRYTTDQNTWKDLRAGDVVPNRAWISTGPRGRAQLVRGVEIIGFQPNTMASITTKAGGFFTIRKTEIVQQVGTLDLEIEKRSQPHTTVQTPYLAAVVKGTIFHVSVGKTKASVSVDRGLVQVTSFASGQRADVGPKQSATVDRKAGMKVAGAVSRPTIGSVATSVAVVPAVGTAELAGQTADAARDKGNSSKASEDSTTRASERSANHGNGSGNGNSGNGGGNSGNGSNNGNGGSNGNGGNGNGNSGGNGNGGGNSSAAGSSGNNGNGNGNGNSGNGGGNSGNGGNNGNGGGNGNNGNGGGNGGNGNNGKGNNK